MAQKAPGNKRKQVVVELIEAKQLSPADPNGKSDPFVQVTIGKAVHKTQTVMSSLNPRWNEKFTLPVVNPDTDVVKFEVFDFDVSKTEDPLGSAQMPLNSLKEGVRQDFWLPLQGKSKSSGSIHVALTPINFGAPAQTATTGKTPEAPAARADARQVLGDVDTPDGRPPSSPLASAAFGARYPQQAIHVAAEVVKDFSAPPPAKDHNYGIDRHAREPAPKELRREVELAAYYKAEASGWTRSAEECWYEAEREMKLIQEGLKYTREFQAKK